jgi:hypothetical protein
MGKWKLGGGLLGHFDPVHQRDSRYTEGFNCGCLTPIAEIRQHLVQLAMDPRCPG